MAVVNTWRFDKVRALLAIPDRALMSSVRHSIGARGLRMMQEAATLEDVHTGLKAGHVDLLITTPELQGGDFGQMLQEMRHHRIGDNPYVIVMTLMENAVPAMVKRVVDCGTDDVLLMPQLPAQVVTRLDGFVASRKNFVITHDYIGPDRRTGERTGAMPAPRLEVPNPVRWQVVANADRNSLERSIHQTNLRINIHKMRRYSLQVTYLVERIVEAYNAPDSQAEMLADANSLGLVAEDLGRRMSATIFAPGAELVLSLGALCDRLRREDRIARRREIEILPTLARAIQRLFDDEAGASTAEAAV
jgi:DNA-binding response OmpR family regulator